MTRAGRTALLLLVWSASTSVGLAQSSSGGPVWPAPPAPARIRFLRSLTPAAVRGRPSLFSRVLSVIAGRTTEPAMTQPYGIAVGPDGRVYVADTIGGTIHIYDVNRSRYSSIDVDAESLIGITVLRDRLVVTDSIAARVICLDLHGRRLWTLGARDGFRRPTGIVAVNDRLFVVDTAQHRVAVVSTEGYMLRTFGTRGSAPGEFNFPTNIARRSDGKLLVTDTMNFRVQVLDTAGRPLGTFGQLGDAPGDFDKPKGIAADAAGHIYVVEGLSDVVQVFDDRGRLLLAFGGSGAGDGQFWLPSGIAIAGSRVYVADSANHRLQMFEHLELPE